MKIILQFTLIGVVMAMPSTYVEKLFEFLLGIAPEYASLLLIICGLVYAVYQVTRQHARFQRLENDVKEMKPQFKELEDRVNYMFEAMEEKFEKRFEKFDERFDKMELKFETRFEKLDARFEKMDARFEKLDGKFDNLIMCLLDGKPEHVRKIK